MLTHAAPIGYQVNVQQLNKGTASKIQALQISLGHKVLALYHDRRMASTS